MRKTLVLTIAFLFSNFATADNTKVNLKEFGQKYFDAMVATQAPDATKQDLENFLALHVDDVGHAHLPYVVDDSRLPDGKQAMRKGMTFYLGAHDEFSAKLLNVYAFNDSAVAIRYTKSAKGIHPQNNQPLAYTSTMMEVLEMEGDKVAVIRKYHE